MRIVPRPNENQPRDDSNIPLMLRPQQDPVPQSNVAYAQIQRAGFKQIFNPSPSVSPPQTPTMVAPASPTTERVLSPENPENSIPKSQPSPEPNRASNIPTGGVPSILRTLTPLSEDSTTSSTPESPPKLPKKMGFKERFLKKRLPSLDTSGGQTNQIPELNEQPGFSSESDRIESPTDTPSNRVNGDRQRPLSPETAL